MLILPRKLLVLRLDLGWEMHADGLAHLMQIGGPDIYVNPHYKSLLLEQRSILVSSNLCLCFDL
jgi:hypothetical protein